MVGEAVDSTADTAAVVSKLKGVQNFSRDYVVKTTWSLKARQQASPECVPRIGDVRRGLFLVTKNAPFRDNEHSFTRHVPPM